MKDTGVCGVGSGAVFVVASALVLAAFVATEGTHNHREGREALVEKTGLSWEAVPSPQPGSTVSRMRVREGWIYHYVGGGGAATALCFVPEGEK